jgi:hypothetical protein
METKPYNLQSPEQIAKEYGGNKQKIAEAMQMGIIDPTAGTMAAMFIDRMRSAAQTEAAPRQTVAQQIFAPPAPVAPGLGAPPAPPQPPMGAPAGLGATPEAAAMAPQMPPMPQGGPGMAMGGMVPPYASGGGLSDMPLPDGMFDEPSNGGFGDGYAGGGIVAFLTGGEVDSKDKEKEKNPRDVNGDGVVDGNDIFVPGQKDDENLTPLMKRGTMFGSVPSGYGGYDDTLGGNLETINQEAPRLVKRYEQYQAYLDKMLDPEERKKSKKEDMWMALGQIGARMATTPGSLLQAAGAGIGEALPGIAAAAKERRGAERAIIKDMMDQERIGNKEVMERANMALDMLKGYNVNEKSFQDQNFTNVLTRLGFDTDIVKANILAGAGIREALIGADASRFGTIKGFEAEQIRAGTALTTALGEFLKSPQGLMGINAARKAGITDSDYISSVRKSLAGGETIRYDKNGNQI